MCKEWKPLYEEKWLKLERLVLYSHMLANALSPANNQMEDRQFIEGAAAAFNLIADALDTAHDIINGYDYKFKIAENWSNPDG